MTTPERSREQRLDALERGNRIRFARAALKRRLHDDHRLELIVEVLEHRDPDGRLVAGELRRTGKPPAPEHYLDTMRVYDVLIATSGIGRVKASKLLKLTAASPSKTLAGISERQRRELIAVIRGESGHRFLTSRRYHRQEQIAA